MMEIGIEAKKQEEKIRKGRWKKPFTGKTKFDYYRLPQSRPRTLSHADDERFIFV